jgi:hypothetical protein
VRSADVIAIGEWATACLAAGHRIYIPEVIDYKLRRELLRAGKVAGISRQALTLTTSARIIVATTNVAHISRFVPADRWTNITP